MYRKSPAGSRSGSRSSRLEERRRRRRKRLTSAILISGVILAGVAFIIGSRVSGSGEPRAVVDPSASQSQSDGNLLIGIESGGGSLEHLLVVLSEEDGDYSVITVPMRTVAETEDEGFARLDALAAAGDGQRLTQALSSLLQTPLGEFTILDRQTLETAADRAGTINLSTDTPVSNSAGETVLEAGDNPRSASTALDLLDASLADPASGPRLQALFFRGLRDAIAALPEQERQQAAEELAAAMETDLGDEQLAAIISGLSDRGRSFGLWALPVSAAGSGEDWYLEPVMSQVQALIQGSNLAQSFNLTVENGTETEGLVEAVGAKLAPLRYNINLNTATSGVNYDHTQIRCGSEALQECEQVAAVLGTGTIIKDEYLDSRQIIVIIGMDMAPAAP